MLGRVCQVKETIKVLRSMIYFIFYITYSQEQTEWAIVFSQICNSGELEYALCSTFSAVDKTS